MAFIDHFSLLDLVAVCWFFVAWIGFNRLVDHSRRGRDSLRHTINHYRYRWMKEMRQREMKMVDTQIMGNLITGIAFFASTSILIVGGLCAALGAGTEAVLILSDLPFTANTSRLAYDVKVLLLIGIFVYAFLKFSWSFRLANYCTILIGAADGRADAEPADSDTPGTISTLIGLHFERGLRSFYFALAALGWFIHPVTFLLATTVILVMQYRREFRSRSLHTLQAGLGGRDPSGSR